MDAIVAVYADWGIGADGTQPIVLKADRQRFVDLTRGKTVIVGRKTLADFPGGKPLKNRRNIVITRQKTVIDGAETANSAEAAIALCGGEATVLGGQSVFREFMPYIDRVFVTKIFCCPKSDSYFEDLDAAPEWRIAAEEPTLSENGVEYRFVCYERIKP